MYENEERDAHLAALAVSLFVLSVWVCDNLCFADHNRKHITLIALFSRGIKA